MNLYTHQKLMDLERERLARVSNREHDLEQVETPRKSVFGPLAAGAGRALRRVGEGLESWGAPPPRSSEPDHRHAHDAM